MPISDSKNRFHLPTFRIKWKENESSLIPVVVVKIKSHVGLKKCDQMQPLPTWTKITKSTNGKKCLQEFLRRKSWAAAFHGFLEDEFSEENLDFWSDVEAYKKSSSKKQVESARKIFQKYVATDSPQEINIDAATRKVTLENLNHPDNSTFNEAQERVLNLMEKDSFKRFLSQTSSRCDNKNYLKSDQQKNLQNEFPKQSALCNLAKNESKTKTVGKQTSKSLFLGRFSSHPGKSFPHPSKFRKRVFTM